MDSARIGLIPLLICVGAVVCLEAAVQGIKADPLMVTAGIRLVDICLVMGIVYIFHGRLNGIGLSRRTAPLGVWQGILWSAGFGALVIVMAAVLYVAGISPFSLIQVQVPKDASRLLFFMITGGVIGPAAEEMVFRGLIYSFLRRWGVLAALIGSTALFVLAHPLTSGIPMPQIVGGLVFALSYEISKSLFTPVIIHILGNLSLFLVGFASQLMLIG